MKHAPVATKSPAHQPKKRLSDRTLESPLGIWLLAQLLPRLDRLVWRWSGGQRVFTHLPGAEVVWVHGTGAKSGLPRTVPLLGHEDGERVILVASNFGRPRHPAWYHNLCAHPEVMLTLRGCSRRYRAREATPEERERYWEQIAAVLPMYNVYARRAAGRVIPLMLLSPLADGAGSGGRPR